MGKAAAAELGHALNPRIPQQEGYSNFETEQASKRCRVCVPLSDRSRRMESGNTEALKSLMCWRQKQTHMQRIIYWQERCRAYAIPLICIHSQGGGHYCLTSQTMQRGRSVPHGGIQCKDDLKISPRPQPLSFSPWRPEILKNCHAGIVEFCESAECLRVRRLRDRISAARPLLVSGTNRQQKVAVKSKNKPPCKP